MAGRTPSEAVNSFLDPLGKALSCVTDSVLQVGGGYHPSASPHALTVGDGMPVPLDSASGIALVMRHSYRIVKAKGMRGPWKVSTAGYIYELETRDGERLLAYHWHPETTPGRAFPHMHLGEALQVTPSSLERAHLPTGRISFEEVALVAIECFDVKPQRADWQEVLAETREKYERWRTWPGGTQL